MDKETDMKVLLVIGSPNPKGCTYTALNEIHKALSEEDIESDFFHIGDTPIPCCNMCFRCVANGECVFDDVVNEFNELTNGYDGFVFGSPIHYSGIYTYFADFLDRVFFSASHNKQHSFRYKPAAAVISSGITGAPTALDIINNYLLNNQMPIVPSKKLNMVRGNNPGEILYDKEGLSVMRSLARNMAWMLKMKEAGEKAGVKPPEP